jgi:transcriptional regulator with XRE-family HTH domain
MILFMKLTIRNKLGNNIRLLRKKFGYTQIKLSELADIDYKYLQRIESKKPPSVKIDTLEKLAKAFKVPPAELL